MLLVRADRWVRLFRSQRLRLQRFPAASSTRRDLACNSRHRLLSFEQFDLVMQSLNFVLTKRADPVVNICEALTQLNDELLRLVNIPTLHVLPPALI